MARSRPARAGRRAVARQARRRQLVRRDRLAAAGAGAARGPRRHARPVRHRAAAGARRPGDAAGALPLRRSTSATGRPSAWARDRRPTTPRASSSRDRRDDRSRGGRAALEALRGSIVQVPPAASAVHVDGERAYRRFRRGEDVAGAVADRDRVRAGAGRLRRGAPGGRARRALLDRHVRARHRPRPRRGGRHRGVLRGAAPHGDRPLRPCRRRRAGRGARAAVRAAALARAGRGAAAPAGRAPRRRERRRRAARARRGGRGRRRRPSSCSTRPARCSPSPPASTAWRGPTRCWPGAPSGGAAPLPDARRRPGRAPGDRARHVRRRPPGPPPGDGDRDRGGARARRAGAWSRRSTRTR